MLGFAKDNPNTSINEEGTLPASLDAERQVLAGILTHASALDLGAMSLTLDDFSLSAHRLIYSTAMEMGERGDPIDLGSMHVSLIEKRQLEAVGGVAYLTSLTDGFVYTQQRFDVRIRLLKEKSRLRRLLQIAEVTRDRVLSGTSGSAACFAGIQEMLLDLEAKGGIPSEYLVQFSDRTLEGVLTRRESSVVGLSTGIDGIDAMTGGIHDGAFWVVGGRTGEGKSCIGLQIAAANATNGVPVLVITPEMSREQVLRRLWIQQSSIPAYKLQKPDYLTDADVKELDRVAGKTAKWPLIVDDSSCISVQELAARARLHARRDGVKLVIVDYVQLIDAKGQTERERVSRVSAALRQIAKDVCPVVALSQMPRPDRSRLNDRPSKHDLKESGSLENDAHVVMLIYREIESETKLPIGRDELIIAKQREGTTGVEKVTFSTEKLVYQSRRGTNGVK